LRTTGLKTTPLCLATVATTALSTTRRTNTGGFDSSESSEGEDSPPLLPSPRLAMRMHDEKLINAIDAITESEQLCSMAYVENFGKISRLTEKLERLMETVRLVAETMNTNTVAFNARMDKMDVSLVAIKRLLEESMASTSKMAEDNVAAATLLSAQAAVFNDLRFRQGQATFYRVQDVETLVADVKSASASSTCALNELVPMTIQSVLEQSIPPTLWTILGDTISPTLCNVLDGTFSEFTLQYESVGGEVIREVKATLESQQAALAMDYASVRSSLQEVLARLRTLD
jgi:hypothetical protein